MTVQYENITESLGRITLKNPPGNNLDRPDFLKLPELTAFLDSPKLKGLIVCGHGRHFCAGADLAALHAQQSHGKSFVEALAQGKAILETLNRATVPVLAVIKGSCLGAGLELALACHFRFCAPSALLGFPETQHGFLPGLGGTVSAPAIIGIGGALDLLLSGRCVLGDEAFQRGLVDRVVAPGELEAEAITYLQELTSRHHPRLIRSVMASLHDGRFLPRSEALEHESRRFFDLIQDAQFDL